MAGFLLIALAAFWPTADSSAAEEGPIQSWQVALPGMAFAAATASAFVLAATGHPLGTNLTVLAASLGLLLVCSHLLALADSARLLHVNRLAEAMLQRLDSPSDGVPISPASIDPQGRPASSKGKLLDRLQKSDYKEAPQAVSRHNLTTQSVHAPEIGDHAAPTANAVAETGRKSRLPAAPIPIEQGIGSESLRRWVKQGEFDGGGHRPGARMKE